VIGHGVMRDAIDAAAVIAALKSVGIGLDEIADPAARSRLVNIFAKAEASPTGSCADAATSCSTTPISVRPDMPARPSAADRRARRHRRRLCIGGAEHQGPPGGGRWQPSLACKRSRRLTSPGPGDRHPIRPRRPSGCARVPPATARGRDGPGAPPANRPCRRRKCRRQHDAGISMPRPSSAASIV